ncbi:MAG: hypothetical protein WC789_08415 [Lentisphaeria bacterium]|jgi:hypothetical protein
MKSQELDLLVGKLLDDFYARRINKLSGMKLRDAMKERPRLHKDKFQEEWGKAVNRFTRDFANDYCDKDGASDWHALVKFNSGNREDG